MNLRKWTHKRHAQSEFFAKLMEEVGEVAREITNEYDGQSAKKTAARLEDELEHVEFIAHAWREAIIQGKVLAAGSQNKFRPRP
jgi:NTP pyrophosphatase (non-canonical NTP hydrolase)